MALAVAVDVVEVAAAGEHREEEEVEEEAVVRLLNAA